MANLRRWGPATMSVHAAGGDHGGNAPLTMPIYQSAVFTFGSLDQVDTVWEGREPGYVYSRMGNPNVTELENAFARWHGADRGVAASSGMAVIFGSLMALTDPGDRIMVARDVYGGTVKLLEAEMTRMGRTVTWLDRPTGECLKSSWTDDVGVVLVETVSNPLVRVADIPELVSVTGERGARVVIDNTLASPVLCRPLASGADVVVESATKFLGGHSAVIGGVAAGPAAIMDRCREILVSVGTTLDPFAAWLVVSGMMTLSLRVETSSANALGLARFMASHQAVDRVWYPGIEDDPHHALARRLMPGGCGALLAVELSGGRDAVDRLMSRTRLVRFAPSLGDVRTTLAHPATTSHRDLGAEARRVAGIADGLVRISAGIEDLDDLIADLGEALA